MKALANPNGARSVLDLIGSTPVIKLKTLVGKDDAEVWAKLESFNPGGSVKDRICLNMIETAEARYDHRRAYQREHRKWTCADRGGEGISSDSDDARYHE